VVSTESAARAANIGSDLGLTDYLVSPTRNLMLAPLSAAVRGPAGNASLGVLVTMFDSCAAHPALIAGRPDWTATLDISMHGAGPVDTGPIVVDSHLVRVGKKVIVVSGTVYDGLGEEDPQRLVDRIDRGDLPTAAVGLLSFARLPRSAASGIDDYDPTGWVGIVRCHTGPTVAPDFSLYDRIGLRRLDTDSDTDTDTDTGRVELDRTPYVTNRIGTILGGVQAIMVEAAAEAVRPGSVATDVQIHYLSQLRVGPARTEGTLVRDAAGHSVVSVRLTDAGHDDQVLALATVTLQSA
jgi:acyl-coenzyme A thioesterase PaaI-like protein